MGYKQCLFTWIKVINKNKYIHKNWRDYRHGNISFRYPQHQHEQHFHIIKIFGGGYLIYIGLMGLINKKNKQRKEQKPFLIPLLNPKAYLFFAALIPTFIDNKYNITLNFLYWVFYLYLYHS
ncbi:LysE family translocator (plasmid) [Escherichia coli]